MANYLYEIVTNDGNSKKGNIEADNLEQAAEKLRSTGSSIISIKEGSVLNMEITIGKPKAKPRDFAVLCRQFNSLLSAGVSIIDTLEMLADQTEHKGLRKALRNVHDNVQKGDSLALAMRREEIFPDLLVNMVEAGESSGNLESALSRMAVHFEKDAKIKGMLQKALIYPIILMIVAIGVLVVMVVAVIPNFMKTFDSLGADLPVVTKMLMDLSNSLTSHWYIYILVIVLIVVGITLFKKSDTGARLFATIGIKFPVFGKLTQKTAAARFSRTFSTMIASGMPMVEAMEITAKTQDNLLYREACEATARGLQEGVGLSAMLKRSKLFPPLVTHMVGIGEETGNLEEMLDNCANYYDEEVEMATQQVMALLEPMIIIVLAGIVVLILAAIYGPMITLYDSLGNM